MELMEYHKPVLLTETVDGLNVKPDGIYVDVTFDTLLDFKNRFRYLKFSLINKNRESLIRFTKESSS